MGDSNDMSSQRAYKKAMEKETLFRRAESFNKELMEDFRFMEAARIHSGEYEAANLNTSHLQDPDILKELMSWNPHGLINLAAYSHKVIDPDMKKGNNIVEEDMRALRFTTRMAKYPPLDIYAHWLLATPFFSILMVAVISVNSILIAVDLEVENKNKSFRVFLEIVDFTFLMIFATEILLKWMDDFRSFWKEGWNIFDFIITTVSLIPPVIDVLFDTEDLDTYEEDLEGLFLAVKYLRIFRIFRSLNVVTRIHKIRLIWEAVVQTFRELVFITILMGIFFYIFAIVGIHLFERYTISHIPNLKYRTAFQSLPRAFITLFQIFTLDHYSDLLFELTLVLKQWYAPCTYVLLWIFLGSFIFMNIFTGVMVNNFQYIRQTLLTAEEEANADVETFKKLALDMKNFEDEDEDVDKDPHIFWEEDVFQNIKIMQDLGQVLSPTVWPRDTLYQYYIILEAMANNAEEKNYIIKLLDNALLKHLDQ